MENAAEALKIAFAVMLFVMALTLSMSSFSQATQAVKNITTIRDRESNYTYVKPTTNLSRTVGIETIASSIYATEKEMNRIYFKENNGTPIILYKAEDSLGNKVEIDYIDYTMISTHINNIKSTETLLSKKVKEFLDVLMGGKKVENWSEIQDKYSEMIIHPEGLYEYFEGDEFQELLGEYEESSGASKVTKRVVTYVKQ